MLVFAVGGGGKKKEGQGKISLNPATFWCVESLFFIENSFDTVRRILAFKVNEKKVIIKEIFDPATC